MDQPGGNDSGSRFGMPEPGVPKDVVDKLRQINDLIADIRGRLGSPADDPVDDYWIPPWRKPKNDDDVISYDPTYLPDPLPGYSLRSIRIYGVELTQSTQYFNFRGQGSGEGEDNSLPLVANKDLIVRVYAAVNKFSLNPPPFEYTGTLTYEGKTIYPLNAPRRLWTYDNTERRLLTDTLNFRIPAADCRGRKSFRIQVQDANPANVSAFTRAQTVVRADFRVVPNLHITGVLFSFTGNGQNLAAPTGIDLVNSLGRFLPMMPFPGFNYHVCTLDTYNGDLLTDDGWSGVLRRLSNLRSTAGGGSVYVGLLPARTAETVGSNTRGIGNWGVAVGSRDDTRALSHEIGHALMQLHIDACGAPADFEKNYPQYPPNSFGNIGEFGLDTARMTLFNPNSVSDLMTYCDSANVLFPTNTWISPFTYRRLMNNVVNTDGTMDIFIIATVELITAFNFRIFRDGRVELLPSYVVEGKQLARDQRPTTDVVIDLVDASGRPLRSLRCHAFNPYLDPDGAFVDFHEVFAWQEEIAAVTVNRGGHTLGRLEVGSEAPGLRLREPRRLEREGSGDLLRLEWESEPAGELTPHYLVSYSADDGQTWLSLAAELAETRYLVNLDLLPGGERCRLRVTASAGLRSTSVVSEPFEVRRKPRQAYILSPENGASYKQGQPVLLLGAAHSPDFQTTAFDELTWISNRSGLLGTGYQVTTAALPPGRHRITLNYPDGAGGEGQGSVWVEVHEEHFQPCDPDR